MNIDYTQIIVTIITVLIAPMLLLLINQGIGLLKAKKNNIYYDKYIDLAGDMVTDVVKELNNIIVNELKSTDKFTKDKQIEVLNIAKMQVSNEMSEHMKKILNEVIGDVDLWVQTKIEAEVSKNKGG